MNEQALNDAYLLFIADGYNGTLEEFVTLINTNQNALQDSYTLFQNDGYDRTFDDYQTLIGVKKKDEIESDLQLEDGTSEQQESRQAPTAPQGEQDTLLERTFGKNSFTDFFGDLYRAGSLGAAQGRSVNDALALFASGKDVSEETLNDYRQAVMDIQAQGTSDELLDYNKTVQEEGGGLLGFIKGFAKNPSVAPQVLISSVRGMFGGGSLASGGAGAAAGGLTAGPLGAGIGFIAGASGALETAMSFTEFLQEELEGKAFTNDNIREVLEDQQALNRIRRKSASRGLVIGAVDAITGGVAAKVGAKVFKAGTTAARAGKALTTGVIEGAGGATGEAAARVVAGQEQDAAEIGLEAVGGGPITAFNLSKILLNPVSRKVKSQIKGVPVYKINNEARGKEEVEDFIANGTDQEIIGAELQVEGDPVLKQKLDERTLEAGQNIEITKNFKRQYPDISEADLNEVVPLQRELDNAKASPINTQDKEKVLDDKINSITNKYVEDAIQEPSPEEISVQEQSETSTTIREGDTEGTTAPGETAPQQTEETAQPTEEVEVEAEISETEIVEKPLNKKYVAQIKNNKLVNIVDTKGNVAPANQINRLQKSFIEKGLIPFALTEFDASTVNPEEANRAVIENSNSPRQIAETIELLQAEKKDVTAVETSFDSGLASMFDNIKFSPESVKDKTGFKNLAKDIGRDFVRTWITKGGKSIKDTYKDPQGVKFEQDEILKFITDYPSRAKYKELFDSASALENEAKVKFTELTGLKPTKQNIKAVAETPSIEEEQTQAFLEERALEEQKKRAEDEDTQELIRKEIERREGNVTPVDTKERKKFLDDIKKEVKKSIGKLTKPFNTITDKLITQNFERLGSRIKSSITRRGTITEGIRSTPTPKVDQVLGLNNSTVVYNTIFEPVYKAYAKFAGEFDVINNKVDRAQNLLRTKGKAKNQNEVNRQSLEIGVYLQALESEANKVDGQFSELAPSVKDMLAKTIDYYRSVGNNMDATALQDIENKFEQNGDITAEGVFSKLNPGQKQAAKILIKQNESVYDFAKTAADRRGRPFVVLKNYTHRQALETQKEKEDVLNKEAEQFSQGAGTFAVTLIKRKKGARAINFNPFQTVKRGTQETYLDYYLTPDVIKTQETARALSNKYKKGNKGQRAASQALQSSLRELLQVTYLNTYTESRSSIANKFVREAKRLAYRALLGSAPRFAAEILGNASMLAAQSPEVIAEAYGKYKDVSMKVGAADNIKFLNILKNLNSGEIRKLGGVRGNSLFDLQADTKYSDDNNILNLSESEVGMKGPVAQKMEYLISSGPKQIYSGLTKVSDFLMGGADRVIARPIWISKFANEFKKNVKKYNKEDIDFTVDDFKALQVEKSNSKYLDTKYKRALDEAVSDADRTSIDLVTSGNPIGAIIKNIRRPEISTLKNYYRAVNSFMANFTLNEYATARFAVGGLLKEGKISQREAALTLSGVLARMSSYVILYKSFSNYLDQLFGAPEDEDEDLSYFLSRQIVGSMSTLMFRQNLGNIPALPINLGIEYINKNYLEELRDGKPYNAYDNSLVYSLVNLDQLGNKPLPLILAPVAFGPAGPAFRDLSRIYELTARTQTRKTEDARQRAYDELMNVYTFDVFGQLGLIPFYKDVRRINRKKFFDQEKKDSKSISKSQLKKLNPELYKRLYGPDSPRGRMEKRKRELRKRLK
tara:strand:- start:4848 stop:9935 length:5088 start_codon:yes stop_codon:yes gene_type:complete